jgi:hypothetical protein
MILGILALGMWPILGRGLARPIEYKVARDFVVVNGWILRSDDMDAVAAENV